MPQLLTDKDRRGLLRHMLADRRPRTQRLVPLLVHGNAERIFPRRPASSVERALLVGT